MSTPGITISNTMSERAVPNADTQRVQTKTLIQIKKKFERYAQFGNETFINNISICMV